MRSRGTSGNSGCSQANRFREAFEPEILEMEFRLAELENPVRQHGVQLGQVADRKVKVDELKRASLVTRLTERGLSFLRNKRAHRGRPAQRSPKQAWSGMACHIF
jgi:hypothetical protein